LRTKKTETLGHSSHKQIRFEVITLLLLRRWKQRVSHEGYEGQSSVRCTKSCDNNSVIYSVLEY